MGRGEGKGAGSRGKKKKTPNELTTAQQNKKLAGQENPQDEAKLFKQTPGEYETPEEARATPTNKVAEPAPEQKAAKEIPETQQKTENIAPEPAVEKIPGRSPGQGKQSDDEQYEAVKQIIGETNARHAQMLNIRNMGIASGHGLTKAEIAAVVAYTSGDDKNEIHGDKAIKRALQGDKKEYKRLKPLIDNLLSGLAKLPIVEGQVSRGTNLTPKELAEIEKTGFYTTDRFLSTTRGTEVSPNFRDKKNYLHLYSKNGRDVSSLSAHKDQEKEVLFLPGTRFKVTNKKQEVRAGEKTDQTQTRDHYYMEEVPGEDRSETVATPATAGGGDKGEKLPPATINAVSSEADIMFEEIPGGPRGSNPAGIYTGKDGKIRYVKSYANQNQAYNELVANTIYQAAGVPAPKTTLVKREDGTYALATEWIKGFTLDRAESTYGTYGKQASQQVLDNFIMDFWMVNFDAVGLVGDNALVDEHKTVHRIDNGGALLFRAKGKDKTAEELSAVDENEINKYIQGGSGGRDGYSRAFDIVGIEDARDPKFVEMIKPQIEKLRQLRAGSNNFETLVPQVDGVPPEIRTKILQVLRMRATAIIGD